MQAVASRHVIVGIEVEPALVRDVPCKVERLQAAAIELDQILLQRRHADGIFDLERRELAIGAVGLDEVVAVFREEAREHPLVLEGGAGEIAEHVAVRRRPQRPSVMGIAPGPGLILMAARAGLRPDETRRGRRGKPIACKRKARELEHSGKREGAQRSQG